MNRHFYLFFSFIIICQFSLAQIPSQLFQQALLKENGEGDLKAAITIYEKIVLNENADRELRAKAQLHIGMCWEKMGKREAMSAYQKVVEAFSDQLIIANEAQARIKKINKRDTVTGDIIRPKYKEILKTDVWIPCADYSPNGKWISWIEVDEKNELTSILLTERKNGRIEKLIQLPETIRGSWLRWNPNGNYISYIAKNKKTKDHTFGLIPIDQQTGAKTGDAKVIDIQFNMFSYDWHPNGIEVCFTGSETRSKKIGNFSIKTKKVKWLDCDAKAPFFPVWGKDGKYIYYCDIEPTGFYDRGVFRINIITKEIESLAPGNMIVDITSDGKYLFTETNLGNSPAEIEVLSLLDNRKLAVAFFKNDISQPYRGIFSPKGYSLIVPSSKQSSSIFKVSLIDGSISKITAAGRYFAWPSLTHGDKQLIYVEAEPNDKMLHIRNLKDKTEKLIPLKEHLSCGILSPDSRYIAYISADDKIENVKIFNVEDGNIHSLVTHKKIYYYCLRWSHDSNYLTYLAKDESEFNLFIISLDGKTTQVTRGDKKVRRADWFKDNKRIIYTKTQNDTNLVVIYSLEENKEKVLIKTELDISAPLLSPDEKLIALDAGKDQPIYISSISDTKLSPIGPKKRGYHMFEDFVKWTDDSKHIVAIVGKSSDYSELVQMNTSDPHEQKPIISVDGYIGDFTLTSDGSNVYYDLLTYEGNTLWEVDFSEAIEKLK